MCSQLATYKKKRIEQSNYRSLTVLHGCCKMFRLSAYLVYGRSHFFVGYNLRFLMLQKEMVHRYSINNFNTEDV